MDTVLKKLKLQDLTEKFQTEHITLDIVCKLLVHEMEMLGINSRSDMSLRIECTKFGGEAPKKLEGTCGAPIFFIPQSVLGDLLQEGFTIKEISSILAVSESTVYRRMRQYGLSKFEFTEISDKDLDAEVEKVTVEFPYCGENFIKQILYQKGVKVQRMRVRDSIHRVDHDGVNARKKGRLHRRVYNVKGLNHLWHIDTNHKLVWWYFVIVGIIDGFSRLPVAIECHNNNKAETVLQCFLNVWKCTVSQVGCDRIKDEKMC